MKKSIIVALVSVALAAIFSGIYFYNHRGIGSLIDWGMSGFVYVGFQAFVGLVLKETYVGKGLLLGSGLILLIGVSICSAASR